MKTLLVIATNGKQNSSIYDSFIVDQNCEFEILLFDYSGSGQPKLGFSHQYFLSKSTECKGQIFLQTYEYVQHHQIEYDYIGFLDDDILIRASEINYMLKIAKVFQLDAFAPSLSHDSQFSLKHTLKVENRILRWEPWIEQMFPILKKELFIQCHPFYYHSISGWGIDALAMPTVAKLFGLERIAIIDAVMMCHYRPVTSGTKVYSNGLTAHQEYNQICKACRSLIQNKRPDLVDTEWYNQILGFTYPGID